MLIISYNHDQNLNAVLVILMYFLVDLWSVTSFSFLFNIPVFSLVLSCPGQVTKLKKWDFL